MPTRLRIASHTAFRFLTTFVRFARFVHVTTRHRRVEPCFASIVILFFDINQKYHRTAR